MCVASNVFDFLGMAAYHPPTLQGGSGTSDGKIFLTRKLRARCKEVRGCCHRHIGSVIDISTSVHMALSLSMCCVCEDLRGYNRLFQPITPWQKMNMNNKYSWWIVL